MRGLRRFVVRLYSNLWPTSFPGSSLYLEKVPWLRLVTCLCMPIQAAQRVGLQLNFVNTVWGGERCAALQTLFWNGSELFVKFVVDFFVVRKGNDRKTVDGNTSIKSKTNSKRMSKYLGCDLVEWKSKIKFIARSIYFCGRHFHVLLLIFSLPHIPKTVQLSKEKIQPDAELTFQHWAH